MPNYVATQTTYTAAASSTITRVPSPAVKRVPPPYPPSSSWEKSEGTDAGFEATLINNHLNIEADYYNRNTLQLYLPVLFEEYLGYTNTQLPENVGTLRNRGVEVTASWRQRTSTGLHL